MAETLLKSGQPEAAEAEFRTALGYAPNSDSLKLGLANAFVQQGKNSHAMVIVEELVRRPDTPSAAFLLHSRLLLRSGDIEFAVTQYQAAVREDPALHDGELAEILGIEADDEAEVVDGRLRASFEILEEGPDFSLERPHIGFNSVGGMAALKEEIRMKIIYPLQHAEMFKAYGKAVGGGRLHLIVLPPEDPARLASPWANAACFA